MIVMEMVMLVMMVQTEIDYCNAIITANTIKRGVTMITTLSTQP